MAQRSRAAAACLLCKTVKSRCSDYRPCARCKKSGTDVCMDLPQSAALGSDRSAAIGSVPVALPPHARGGNAQAAKCLPQPLDGSSKWRLAASAHIAAAQPSTPNQIAFPESQFSTDFYPTYDFFLHHGRDTVEMEDAMSADGQVRRSKTSRMGVLGAVM